MATPREFDDQWKTGDREVARQMAVEFVALRPDLEPLKTLSIEELVDMVTSFRQAGDEENRIIVDMVLLAVHAPQQITGEVHIGGAEAIAMAESIIAEARSQ